MDSGFGKRAVSLVAVLAIVSGAVLLLPRKADAIPAFSRQYGTSCSTCHVDFPKLNDFGKAFKDAGFKFPKDDETFVKIPPVMLGSPAQKELWPKTIWPGTLPGVPQIGLRMNSFFQVLGRNRNNLGCAATPITPSPTGTGPGTVTPCIPRTDFATGFFSIFTAGNFGSDIAFWVDDDISVNGANANGALGDGYLKFINVGHFAKLPKDSLSVRAGQFELDLPFTQARSYNLSGYDIYGETNVGTGSQFVNNGFNFAAPAQGVEFSGGHNYGGYHYSFAVVNQNTSGLLSSGTANVSPANGNAFNSDSNFKDLYGRLAYRFNLERDPKSRNDVQAAGPMGPRDHTSLRVGTFYLYGRSALSVTDPGVTVLLGTVHEPFYRVGGDLDFHYRQFNLYGLYMYGHDHDVVPTLNGAGTAFTLSQGTPVTFDGGFIQADYMVYPWLMAIMRWDAVNSTADRLNGVSTFGPNLDTRNRFTPGAQFLIHANIKASFEYQVQPEFQTMVLVPGQTAKKVFRTNSAVAALEWVY
jgi:hypothetical protein